ncbi:MAG TPA: hypothetical protein VGR35_08670 [Tepidisphaeraceae bacterium]|nr:hypothetical protein [Tepidisphaeraceae bacterium]
MLPQFAYSFDRHSYTGPFNSREEAVAAGVARSRQLGAAAGIDCVYVGMIVQPDPQASGHAEELIKNMVRRARGAAGESYEGYLTRVTEQQEAELDENIERGIMDWLKKYDMMPQFTKVRGVSEHPIPGGECARASGTSDDVRVGTSDYSAG